MFTTKSFPVLPNEPASLPAPSFEPLPEISPPIGREVEEVVDSIVEDASAHLPRGASGAAELWKNLPAQEQGILSHLAKSAEELCTPEHLAKLGQTAEAIGSLLTKGLIAQTPLGALHILDPLLKDIAGDASMHLQASGSVAEGGPKTFQFNFGMTANVRKLQPGH
jgi:hypothetical protein